MNRNLNQTVFIFAVMTFNLVFMIRADEPGRDQPMATATNDSVGRDNAIVEALLRLPNVTQDRFPQHRESVARYLARQENPARVLDIVERLGFDDALPAVAALLDAVPFSTESPRAAKLLLNRNGSSLIETAINQTDEEQAASAILALGYANSPVANEMLLTILQDEQRSISVRTAAATSLGKMPKGQRELLRLAQQQSVPPLLSFAVTDALLGSTDEKIRTEAAQFVQPAITVSSEPIPPVRELVELRGTAEKGKIVFDTVGTCIKCHKVLGEGTEVGPDLSEIGSKITREEMFVAILNPSAAVSHNYETYKLLTLDGVLHTGTLINQTDEWVTIRSAEGIDTTVPAEDVEALEKQAISLMPADLQKAMPLQSLVDLVDYMVLLRKPGEAGFNQVAAKNENKTQAVAGDGSRDPQDAIAGLDVADGIELQLFSAEPMSFSPTSIDVDHLGRVWVCEAVNYRHFRNPNNEERAEGDRILVMEDVNHDGTADKVTVFHQGTDIDSPHGVCVLGRDVIVSAGANVWVFTDEDADLKADKKRALFTGIGGVQHDHGIHALTVGPDGKIYFNFGNEGKQIRDAHGNPIIDLAGNTVDDTRHPYQQGMVFRCNLDGSEFETLGWNFRNNWELCVDSFGTIWQSDNDDDGNRGTRINYVMEYGNYGYLDEKTGATWKVPRTGLEKEIPLQHWHLNDGGVVPNLLQTGAGSPTGIAFYEGDLLPPVFRNQMIHCDPGPNVVRTYPVTNQYAGYSATIENMVQGARDQWFRPVDVSAAPDGSLLIADWYDPGVGGHRMGDTKRGRIFRVTVATKKDYQFEAANFSSVAGAVQALQSPNTATRFLAQQSLLKFGAVAVPALTQILDESPSPRMRARAAWQLARVDGRAAAIVESLLQHGDSDLRITGIRIARQHKLNLIELAQRLVRDASPQVRRELAIALRHDSAAEMPNLWAQLAVQHDGRDRWYLEALGIGANLRADECFDAWLKLVGDDWNTTAGHDIIWRSRSAHACAFLAKIILETDVPSDQDRYFRAMDFHNQTEVAAALNAIVAE